MGIEKQLRDHTAHSLISLEQFFPLAVAIAATVYEEHRQNVIIENLSPIHIVIREDNGGLTARLSGNSEICEAYRSPEQSGKMNRAPDERSDLYALGVVFYELLTGQLPLRPQAGETWENAHIRREPAPMSMIRPDAQGLPEAIVMKLLAKAPEDRYQSAYGLLDDLRQCTQMGQARWKLPYELGRRDRLRSMRLADSWRGHRAALERLAGGVEQAIQGKQALRLVVGEEGIGKTTLVHRLQEQIVRSGGWLIEGQGLLPALRQGIEQLWSEPAAAIALLQERLQAAYRPDEAHTVALLLPELAPLLGAADGSGTARRDRAALLADLVRCLAAVKPPLVLFIDDLEQADQDTHEALRLLSMEAGTSGLLLIGAWRTETGQAGDGLLPGGAFDALHTRWLYERWQAHPSERVLLLPLSDEELRSALADAMSEPVARLSLLSQAIHEQTAGNPRDAHTLLESWIQAKRLTFDDRRHRWVWDQELTESVNGSESYRRQVEESLAKVAAETKELLIAAAAVGSTFQPAFLAQVCGLPPERAASMLREAEEQGLICAEGELPLGDAGNIGYSFLNHIVHQALYAAGGERNAQRHRQIGLLLQAQTADKPQLEAQAVTRREAIDHLNLAAEALDTGEVQQLAASNWHAGKQALGDGRFAKAKHYAEAGLKLAKREARAEAAGDGSLYVQLKLVAVWAEYMLGNLEQAQQLLYDLKEQGSRLDKADRVQVWTALIRLYSTVDNDAAIQYSKEALAEYHWKLRDQPSKSSLFKEVMYTRLMLYQYRNKIERLPINRDEDYTALSGLMEQALFPLLISNAGALVELYARFIRYGLRRGMNETLACVIGAFEQTLYRVMPFYTPVIPYAKLASLQRSAEIRPTFASQIEFVGAIAKQVEHPREASVSLVRAMRRGLEFNDTDLASLAMITFLVSYNGDVPSLLNVLDFFDSHMRHQTSDMVLQLVEDTRSYTKALQDESELRRFIAIPEAALTGESNYNCGCKLEAAFLAGCYEEAVYWAGRGRETELEADWLRIRKQRIYETLSLAALYADRSAAERRRISKALRAQLKRMKKWKGFLGYRSAAYFLLSAEWKRITETSLDALREYMAAIKQAREDKDGLMEGIACERLAICYRHDLVSRSGAMIAMMDACTAYSLHGISFKAVQIRMEHADLLQPMSNLYGGPVLEVRHVSEEMLLSHSGENRAFADNQAEGAKAPSGGGKEAKHAAESVWRMMDSLRTLEMTNWQTSLLGASLQQSGADRALLVRHTDDGFSIEAQLDRTADAQTDYSAAEQYAESVLRHTVVTNRALVLEDAARSYFLKDKYVREQGLRSVLCMPLAIPGDRRGVLLYLENTQIADVFTEQDVKLVELIATKIIYRTLLEDEDLLLGAMETAAAHAMDEGSGETTAMQSAAEPLVEPLTGRELEILQALAEGLSNRDIAQRFGIAETTVKTHTTRIFGKLGVKRRGQAVARAKQLQLLK